MDLGGPSYVGNVIATTEVDGTRTTINPSMLDLDGTASFQRLTTQSPLQYFNDGFTPTPPPDHDFRSSPPFDAANAIAIARREVAQELSQVSTKVYPPRFQPLPQSTLRSGLVYSSTMRLHAEPNPDPDDSHPESPERIIAIFQDLVDAGLAPDPTDKEGLTHTDEQLLRIPPAYAQEEELQLVHSPEHVAFIRSLEGMSIDQLRNEAGPPRDSVYFNNHTWMCATLSVGCAIQAARAVVSEQVKNAFAVIRPPGHHCEPHEPSGFCMFNNVPVAARVMQKEFPKTCRKILILDWDVHHGNGIQTAFYNDPNVLYISLHVYKTAEGDPFYPQTTWGDPANCGEDIGLGKNVNVAWLSQNMGDADYIFAFQQVVMPIAIEFDPDLVMISAGFDAAEGDPLGSCHVSPAGYGHMTHMLMQLAKGKVVACLEGGYNLEAISKSALAMTRVLMGEPPDRLTDTVPTPVGVKSVQQVMRLQSKFWKCLYPKSRDAELRKELGSERLHDIIREWQSGRLWKEHKMSQLLVLRKNMSKSFENQVLATPNYHEARPLLVIFHDPPEALGHPDVRTNQLELHNTWLVSDNMTPIKHNTTDPIFKTDVSKTYVDWAVRNEFAVIDVNIPKHLTDLEVSLSTASRSNDWLTILQDRTDVHDSSPETIRAAATQEIAFYLWRNYIECSDFTDLFLLGIGDAYIGITKLFSEYATACTNTDHTFGFISQNSLRALKVRELSDEGTATVNTFYERSSVYVSHTHAAFDEGTKVKLKKKHGRIVKSREENMQEMLHVHFPAVTAKMAALTEEWRAENVKKGRKMLGAGNGNGAAMGNLKIAGLEDEDELGRGRSKVASRGAGQSVNGSLNRRAAEGNLEGGSASKRARNGA
jgi:histone deacetylase 6